MYFLRRLKKLDIDFKLIQLLFPSVIQSVINFSISCWYENCIFEARNKLSRTVQNCEKKTGSTTVLQQVLPLFEN